MRERALGALRVVFGEMSAAEVADVLLSPFIASALLKDSTAEAGPSLWIVNRSDVFDATLAALTQHAQPDIAARARAKQAQRASKLSPFAPPRLESPLEKIPDHEVEDILGHPLVPWEAVLFFARSLNEDHRASAALSLTRRLLEHPPGWLTSDPWVLRLRASFGALLTNDPSPFVRAYSARIPLFHESDIAQALAAETHAFVFGRLLQNPALAPHLLRQGAERALREPCLHDDFTLRVLAFDSRLEAPLRRHLRELSNKLGDKAALAAHDWHLASH